MEQGGLAKRQSGIIVALVSFPEVERAKVALLGEKKKRGKVPQTFGVVKMLLT